MKSIPLLRRDPSSDGIIGPFLWYGVPARNRNKESVFCTFQVYFVRDLASCFPFICIAGYILGDVRKRSLAERCTYFVYPFSDPVPEFDVAFIVVWGWSAGIPGSR